MNRGLTEMIWEKIDGTIDSKRDAELEAILGNDADAREQYTEIVRFSELIGGVEELEPPTALRDRIEGAIDFDRYAARGESTTPRTVKSWINPIFNLRIATALAAGFVVGVVAYHLAVLRPGPSDSFDRTSVVGAIGQPQGGLTIDLEGIEGDVRFWATDSRAVSEIALTSDREIELSLEYAGSSIEFRAVGDTGSPLGDIVVSDGAVTATSTGEARYVASFARAGDENDALRVRISSGGDLLFDEEIRPEGSR